MSAFPPPPSWTDLWVGPEDAAWMEADEPDRPEAANTRSWTRLGAMGALGVGLVVVVANFVGQIAPVGLTNAAAITPTPSPSGSVPVVTTTDVPDLPVHLTEATPTPVPDHPWPELPRP